MILREIEVVVVKKQRGKSAKRRKKSGRKWEKVGKIKNSTPFGTLVK